MMKCGKLNGFALGLVLFAMPLAVPVARAENATITWAGITVTYSNATKTTSSTGDLILKFTDTTAPGTFVLPENTPAWYLAVGGGGAGGTRNSALRGQGGGGGAGGYVEKENAIIAAGLYTVNIGTGGVATAAIGLNGGDTVVTSPSAELVCAYGGGGGGNESAGNDGGSGGGGSKGSASSGFDGGSGLQGNKGGFNKTARYTGGGGGAGEPGKDGTADYRGAGGQGRTSEITGEIVWYAGGGGGGFSTGNLWPNGTQYTESETGEVLSEDRGGGGNGSGDDSEQEATPGIDGTGGGGGGGGRSPTGAKGGSGVFIVRLLMPAIQPTPRTGLVYTGLPQNAIGELDDEIGANWKFSSGTTNETNAGEYSFEVVPVEGLKWKDTGNADPKTITWTIGTAEVAVPVATDRTYNGSEQVGVAESPLYTLGGTPKATVVKVVDDAVAPYGVTATLNNVAVTSDTQRINATWADGTTNDVNLTWTMHPNVIDPPYRELYYNGTVQDGAVTSMFYTIVGGTTNAQDVGSYTYECALHPWLNPTNVHWSLGDMENKLGSFDILPLQVPVPAVRKVLLLNAEAKKGQTAVPSADASGICYAEAAHGEAYCRVTGYTATALGAYTVTATLLNTNNFLWATLPPTTVDQHIPWYVQSARTNDLGRIVMEHDRIATE